VQTVAGVPRVVTPTGATFRAKAVCEWGQNDNVAGIQGAGNSLYAPIGFGQDQFNNMSTIVSTMTSWGVNMVRYRLNASYYDGLTISGKTAYVAQVKAWHDAIVNAGMIFFPCLWDGLEAPYGGTAFPSNYQNLYPTITAVYNAIDDPYMPWEPANEPNNITSAQTLTAMKGLWFTLRNLGCKGILVADWTDWANSNGAGFSDSDYTSLEQYDASLLGSSQHQTAFAKHNYANGSSSFSGSGWQGQVGNTTTHVIFETEFGNQNGATSSENRSWNLGAISYFQALQTTMPNFMGACPFLFAWIDDNTMTQTNGNTTRSDDVTTTQWGADARGVYS
jgi:hypothetical protein